jgi:hypothetical protein
MNPAAPAFPMNPSWVANGAGSGPGPGSGSGPPHDWLSPSSAPAAGPMIDNSVVQQISDLLSRLLMGSKDDPAELGYTVAVAGLQVCVQTPSWTAWYLV